MAIQEVIESVPDRVLFGVVVLVVGVVLGWFAGRVNRRVLVRAGVPEAVEGTAFERTARRFGTSTVEVVSALSMWFIVGVAVLAALSVADVQYTAQFWAAVTGFLPNLFVAALVLIAGIVVGDKAELAMRERLRGIKIPQVGVIPLLLKYSVVYVAALIALGQVGVVTEALLILLAVYFLGIVFLGGLAFRDLLASGAAGMYLLLSQPYSIGDRIRVDERRGIVQEVSVFVTRIESDSEEYVVPNRLVFAEGVARERE